MIIGERIVDLTDATTIFSAQSSTHGIPRRVVVNSSGNVYLVTKVDGDTNLRITKWSPSTANAAPTTFSGSGEHTAVENAIYDQMWIGCDIDASDILHIIHIANDGGTKTVFHNRFDTSDDTWVSGEITVDTGGVATPSAYDCLDVHCDSAGDVHLVWWNEDSAESYNLYYSKYTSAAWTAKDTVKSGQSAPWYCPRVNSDNSGRVLLISDDGDETWTGWETPGAWVGTSIAGLGSAIMVNTPNNTRHILFAGDKRHTIVKGALSSLTTTVGAIKFEHPGSDGGTLTVSGDVAAMRNLGFGVIAKGDDLIVTAAVDGSIYQAQYKHNVWGTLRSVQNLHSNVGIKKAWLLQLGQKLLSDGNFAGVWVDGRGGDASNPSKWSFLLFDQDPPPRATVTHDLVIDDKGYMLASPLLKSDLSQATPRVSVATEVKSEDNLSDLSSSTQVSWHHGRGDRDFNDPFSFLDTDNMHTHIPNQATPFLEVTSSSEEDLNGYPVDGVLYQGNFYVLIRGNAAANNSLQVWDNTNTEWDAVAATIDTSVGIPQDLEIADEDLWVAQGDGVASRVYDFSTTAWVTGTVPAYCFKYWDGKLWRADNINEIHHTSDPEALGSATWTLLGYVDDGSGTTGRIRRFEVYAGSLLVFADFGVMQIINDGAGGYWLLPLLDDAPQRDADNGLAAANFGGLLHYNVQEGVTRFDGSTRIEIGPNRSPIGSDKFTQLPTLEYGTPNSMAATDTFLYMAVDPFDTTSGIGTVWIYGGTGWHKFWKSSTAGERVKWVFFTPILATTGVFAHRTLWVNQGDVIKYIQLPDHSENPLSDSNLTYVTATGSLITGWDTRGFAFLTKIEHEIMARADNIYIDGTTKPVINVYFQIEEGVDSFTTSDWTYLGTFNREPFDTVRLTEQVTKDGAPDVSGAVGGLAYTRIRYLLEFNNVVAATPIVLRAFGQRFTPRTKPRYGFTAVVKAYKQITRLDGAVEEDDARDDIRNSLYALQLKPGPHYVSDGSLVPVVNHIKNASFELDADADGLADNWAELDATKVASTISEKHSQNGIFSQKLVIASATAVCGIGQTVYLPAGIKGTFGVSVYNEGVGPVVLQIYDSTNSAVLAQSKPIYPTPVHRIVADFEEVVLEVAEQTEILALSFRIVAPTENFEDTTVYVDSAFFYMGDNVPKYFIDGTMARCQWAEEPIADVSTQAISAFSSKSVQRESYACYVTGMNEVFRFRDTEEEIGSQLTLFMREASE
jgi:hypothetical protein